MSEDSGWTAALVEADIATAGTSDSVIKVANIKRTRKAHQVTVNALYVLLQSAYAKYQQDLDDDDFALRLMIGLLKSYYKCPSSIYGI